MMKKLTAAVILISVALIGVGTALADGLTCNDERGCKVCSIAQPANFRDSVTVAETWTPNACEAYAAAANATISQLACMHRNDLVFGLPAPVPAPPPAPVPNTCGW
jgi:hypothetical protein